MVAASDADVSLSPERGHCAIQESGIQVYVRTVLLGVSGCPMEHGFGLPVWLVGERMRGRQGMPKKIAWR